MGSGEFPQELSIHLFGEKSKRNIGEFSPVFPFGFGAFGRKRRGNDGKQKNNALPFFGRTLSMTWISLRRIVPIYVKIMIKELFPDSRRSYDSNIST